MGDSIRLAECFNTTVRDAYELPKKDAVLVMWRDFDESRLACIECSIHYQFVNTCELLMNWKESKSVLICRGDDLRG